MKRDKLFYISCLFIVSGHILVGLGVGLLVCKIWACICIGLGVGLIVTSIFGIKTFRRLLVNDNESIKYQNYS